MTFSKNETLLLFRIAGIPFAVPATSVGSILMPPPHITHTPGSGQSNPGIFHHAHATYAVIDMHQRFGIDIPRLGAGRLLLQEEETRHFAFLVDEVVGLVRSEQGTWANLPPYLPRELFPIGFLYQKEIVLCSELNLLRNMHDVEPLRRHIEKLKQQQTVKTDADVATEKPVERPATTQPVAKTENELAATPADNKPAGKYAQETAIKTESTTEPRTKPETAGTTRVEESKPVTMPPATTSTTKPAASFTTRQEKKLSSTIHSHEQAAKTHTTALKQPARTATQHPQQQTQPPIRAPHTSPHRETPAYATDEPGNDSAWLWLLLFLLLLAALPLGYWLWPEPPRASRLPAITYTPPPSITEEPTPTRETATTAMPEAPIPTAAAPPLRIERDGDGTINLIIDRKAAGNATEEQHAQQPAAVAEPFASETTKTAQLPSQEATVKQPAASEPEPCDCTHIVVKGDTLWDIAELYTGNAFNYPELAKLSGIKNPHRIYPGDKVRIIIR